MSDSRKKSPAKGKKAAQKKSGTATKKSAAKTPDTPKVKSDEKLPFYRKHIAVIEGVGYILLAILMFSVPQIMIRNPNSLAGQFIIAAPSPENYAGDQAFDKTVILVTQHNRRKAQGFVINEPLSSMSAHTLYKKLDIPAPGRSASLLISPAYAAAGNDMPKEGRSYLSEAMKKMSFPVYWGGPMDEDKGWLIFLKKKYAKTKITKVPKTDVSYTEKMRAMNSVISAYEKDKVGPYKIVFGQARWGEGQLDEEMKRGQWQAMPYEQEILFSDNPKGLWNELQKRLEKSTTTDQENDKENTGK